MGKIVQKVATDRVLILDPREFHTRQIDFQNWTEMRMSMFFSLVTAAGDNTQCGDETVALSTREDLITFGLKNNDTDDLPGFAGSLFLGATTRYDLTSDIQTGGLVRSGGGGVLQAVGFAGTTRIGGTVSEGLNPMSCGNTGANATGYAGFYALKFVITNRGLATQSIAISSAWSNGFISGTDYSPSALRTEMNNASISGWSTPITIAWNDGVDARTIPDSFWIRLPFYSNRIRLSCIRATRYAP